MQKFMNTIESKVGPFASRIAANKYIQAIQHTFMTLIPFITIGSLALVIISPPVDPETLNPGFLKSFIEGWSSLAGWLTPSFGAINNVTMGLLALYVSVLMGMNLARQHKMPVAMPTVITSMSFLVIAVMGEDGSMIYDYLGGTGLFTALVFSILSFEAYRKMNEKNFGYIDLSGSGVPPALAESLGNLIPATVILLVCGITGQLVQQLTGVMLPDVISLVFAPIVSIVNSLWGVILLAVLVMVFWWFGIHDTVITGPLDVILMANFTANVSAFAAGTPASELPYIVTEPFWWSFMVIGGSGATFALALLALFSKSKQIRTVGRLAIVPSFFNINEPLIFGLPIMYNPSLLIPFIIVMPLNGVITYLCMAGGLVNRTFAYGSWNMFAPIAAFVATLDWRAVVLILVLIVIDMVIYFPFFKMYEKSKLAEEQKA